MRPPLPIRFRAQVGAATCTAMLLILTLAVPRWIEVLFEAEPTEAAARPSGSSWACWRR